MSDYPMLISNKLHSFRNFLYAKIRKRRMDAKPNGRPVLVPFPTNKSVVTMPKMPKKRVGRRLLTVKRAGC